MYPSVEEGAGRPAKVEPTILILKEAKDGVKEKPIYSIYLSHTSQTNKKCEREFFFLAETAAPY